MSDAMHFAVLVLRVYAGAMICAHGYAHLRKRGAWTVTGTAKWFGSMGMRWPLVQAWLASVTELGAGILLIAGLLTPLAAAGLCAVMTVAFVIAHRKNGFFIYNKDQGWEYVVMITAVTLLLGATGGGRWSLDHALDHAFSLDEFSGWSGLLTVVLAGFGGAAALLLTCWRPPRAS